MFDSYKRILRLNSTLFVFLPKQKKRVGTITCLFPFFAPMSWRGRGGLRRILFLYMKELPLLLFLCISDNLPLLIIIYTAICMLNKICLILNVECYYDSRWQKKIIKTGFVWCWQTNRSPIDGWREKWELQKWPCRVGRQIRCSPPCRSFLKSPVCF